MARLKSLRVQNYQSLKEISLELGKLTVVVGETDSGKSALVRAIQGLVNNQAGDGFVTYGEKNTSVVLEFDNAAKVIWVKGKDNRYTLIAPDGSQADFTKCGTDSPAEIKLAVRMSDVPIGKIRFCPNFHTQFDTPFLLTTSEADVAKILGEITNINLLYNAVREAKSRMSSTRQTASVRKSDLENQREKLKDYVDIESKQVLMTGLKSLLYTIEQAEAQRILLGSLLLNYEVAKKDEQTSTSLLAMSIRRTQALSGISEVGSKYLALKESTLLSTKVSEAEYEYKAASVSAATALLRAQAFNELAKLTTSVDLLAILKNSLKLQEEAALPVKQAQDFLLVANTSHTNSQEALKVFEKNNPSCPLCGKLF